MWIHNNSILRLYIVLLFVPLFSPCHTRIHKHQRRQENEKIEKNFIYNMCILLSIDNVELCAFFSYLRLSYNEKQLKLNFVSIWMGRVDCVYNFLLLLSFLFFFSDLFSKHLFTFFLSCLTTGRDYNICVCVLIRACVCV